MREIKFRAWDGEVMHHFGLQDISAEGAVTGSEHGCFDLFNGERIGEIMQYTGLKDKNGKEIYEGDILEFDDYYFEGLGNGGTGYSEWRRKRGEVKFDNSMFVVGQDFGLAMIIRDARLEDEHYEFEDNELTGWYVIGNIYENPELLGQK